MNPSHNVLPDTNVVLRYLLADVPAQFEEAEVFFEKVRMGETKALLLESVIVECVYILTKHYRTPKEEAAATLRALLQYKGVVTPGKEAIARGLQLFASHSLDLVDCLLLARAGADGARVFSFDKKLNRLQDKQ